MGPCVAVTENRWTDGRTDGEETLRLMGNLGHGVGTVREKEKVMQILWVPCADADLARLATLLPYTVFSTTANKDSKVAGAVATSSDFALSP